MEHMFFEVHYVLKYRCLMNFVNRISCQIAIRRPGSDCIDQNYNIFDTFNFWVSGNCRYGHLKTYYWPSLGQHFKRSIFWPKFWNTAPIWTTRSIISGIKIIYGLYNSLLNCTIGPIWTIWFIIDL